MRIVKYIAIFIAFIAVNQVFILTPELPQNLYYVLLGVALLVGLLLSEKIRINGIMLWLLFAAGLSLIFNTVPAFFQAPLRLITFTAVIALIGPLMDSNSLSIIKKNIFARINLFIFVLASLSFLVYALTLPIRQARGFGGLFNHSMMLGSMAAIALLIGFYSLFRAKEEKLKRKKQQIIYITIVFCFLALLLAASRASIAGAATGLCFFFYKNYQYRIGKLISSLFVIIMLVVVTFPAWSDYTEGIQRKHASAESRGDMASSRRSYWDARLKEFDSSPVWGIGFATLDVSNKGSNVRESSGGIEPGTSWLTILSMIGVIGFIPMFLLFARNLLFLIHDKCNPLKSAVLGGLLIFFITHMFAEGYIFASGGFLFFYVWLLLGILEIYRKNKTIKII